MAVSIYFLEDVKPLEWLVIPFTFLYANFSEYMGHKGPLHHRKKKLDKVFQRHTLEHHRFFTAQEMTAKDHHDFKAVLFPSYLLAFFLVVFALPVMGIIWWLWSQNAALLFFATAFFYFLNYEWLHLTYHLPDGHPIARLPIIRNLRQHHRTHHDPALMTRYNFNISYPIFDWLFGTTFKRSEVSDSRSEVAQTIDHGQ
ncbi:MAG TPA: sterol desaturase family protein [Chitinophagaceae bacterium]|nr:sterol desaturase family protein [Chitinophagaceae bacterium]